MAQFTLTPSRMLLNIVCALSALMFTACQQSVQNISETQHSSDDIILNQSLSLDSVENAAETVADHIYDGSANIPPSIIIKFDGGWLADKELNTVRRILLENTTDKKVIGVKIAYGTGINKEFDNRNVGKFKVNINPYGKTMLQIRAKRFGVSDDIIESPSYTSLMFRDSIVASVTYFSDGTIAVN